MSEKKMDDSHCTCDNLKCPRHGNCRECVLFHRDEKHNLPRCLKYMLQKR